MTPIFALTLLEGYLVVSTGVEHNAEKIVDLPTLGSPNMPQFNAMLYCNLFCLTTTDCRSSIKKRRGVNHAIFLVSLTA